MSNFRTYLGDSVYADFDGDHIFLYLDNGKGHRHHIYLEEQVMVELLKYKERIDNERRKHLSNNQESS